MNPRTMIGQSVRFISSKFKNIGFKEFNEIKFDINNNPQYLEFITKPDEFKKRYSYRLQITFEGEYNE